MCLSVYFREFVLVVLLMYYCNYVYSVEIECIPLKSCPTALKIASTWQHAPETYDFFKVTHCGYDEENQPKVWCSKFDKCVTPQNRNGTCMSVKKCKPFLKLRATLDISNPRIESYLNKFHCNEILEEEHVCCPNDPVPEVDESARIHDRFFNSDYNDRSSDESLDYADRYDFYPNHEMEHNQGSRNKHTGWRGKWEPHGLADSNYGEREHKWNTHENIPRFRPKTERHFFPKLDDFEYNDYPNGFTDFENDINHRTAKKDKNYFDHTTSRTWHYEPRSINNNGEKKYNNNDEYTTENYESSTKKITRIPISKRVTTEKVLVSTQTTERQESITTKRKDFDLDINEGGIIFEDSFKEILEGKRRRNTEQPTEPSSKKSTTDESVQPCKTPDGKSGACISANSCSHYLNLRRNLDRSRKPVRDYLGQFSCGTSGGVCCQRDETVEAIDNSVVNEDRTNGNASPLSKICGRQTATSDRIVGGSVAGLGEFPWLALLQYPSNTGIQRACGGTLINSRYVLTAAHCVDEGILRSRGLGPVRQVVLGEYDTRNKTDCIYMAQGKDCADPPKTYIVESVIRHNLYATTTAVHDIALLRLDQDVTFTDYILPICLPTKTSTLKGNETFTISGWGRTSTEAVSPVLRKAKLPYVDRDKCNRRKRSLIEGQMCAGLGDGTDHCNGDSGGPVMLEVNINFEYVTQLIGIISYGFSECGKGPSVNTYVPYYIDWINDKIKP